MAKTKNMQTTPAETSAIKGLVAHGMPKDLSKEVIKIVKGLIDSSAPKSGKTTTTKAPQGHEYATKVDLLTVKMELKDEINTVRVEIKDVKNDLLKWFIGLFLAQTIAMISAIKYFVN
jgi:hypothetical protein